MIALIAALFFMQTVVPDQLANVVPDPSGAYPADLSFSDGTVWGLTLRQGCDWLKPTMQVVWQPSADGSVGTLTQIGNTDLCYVDTTVVWAP